MPDAPTSTAPANGNGHHPGRVPAAAPVAAVPDAPDPAAPAPQPPHESDQFEPRQLSPFERIVAELGRVLSSRVPEADLDERDPDYIRDLLPTLWLMSSLWFRGEVRGLEHIPAEGPVLLVGNHSGGNLTPDSGVFTVAFCSYFGVERRFHQLAHNMVLSAPGLGFLRRMGTVAASHENARRALEGGAAVLVYPGGDYEVHRPTWESGTVDFDRRKGFLRLALDLGVPIVPVVSIGGQETSLFLSRGEGLSHALGLDRFLRLKVLPISLSVPWGINVGDFLPRVPLPAKITIQVLPAIDLAQTFGPDPDLDVVYDHVVGDMQATLDRLSAERRLPIVG